MIQRLSPGLLAILLLTSRAAGLAATQGATTASDRSTPEAAYRTLLAAIERDDVDTVADSICLPVDLQGEHRRLMAERWIAGSKLVWAVEKRFGIDAGTRVTFAGGFARVLSIDETTFDLHAQPHPGTPFPIAVLMSRSGGAYQLNKTNEPLTIFAWELDDAPVRNAVARKTLANLNAGKFADAAAVIAAVVPPITPKVPTTLPTDRSSPYNVPAAILAAIDSGDLDSYVDCYEARNNEWLDRIRIAGERAIISHKLADALYKKFGLAQGKRLADGGGLDMEHRFPMYPNVQWSVDGDIAHSIRDGRRYDAATRLSRHAGLWRIELPVDSVDGQVVAARGVPPVSPADRQRNAALADLLAHLDRYPDPGSVADALNAARNVSFKPPTATQPAVDRQQQMVDQLHQMKKTLADHGLSMSARERDGLTIFVSLQRQLCAVGATDYLPGGAYFADHDGDGAYVRARARRLDAARYLARVADREVGAGMEGLMKELTLYDAADDAFSLLEVEWTIQGDRAAGTLPGISHGGWLPGMRQINGEWKIDVTGELTASAAAEADRANREAALIEAITARTSDQKFKTSGELKSALVAAGIRGTGKSE